MDTSHAEGPWYEQQAITKEAVHTALVSGLMALPPLVRGWPTKGLWFERMCGRAASDIVEGLGGVCSLGSHRGYYTFSHLRLLGDARLRLIEHCSRAHALKRLMQRYVQDRLYRWPDGLRLKNVQEHFEKTAARTNIDYSFAPCGYAVDNTD